VFPSAGAGNFLYNIGTGKYFYIGSSTSVYGGYASVYLSPSPYTLTVSQDASGYSTIAASSLYISGLGYQSVYIHDEGGIYVVTASYNYPNNQPARNQWYLEAIPNPLSNPPPVPMINKNPLPKGTYRIRSFNGNYLLTMPKNATGVNGSPFVTQQVPKDDYQKWTVVPQTNGLFTIANAGNNLYLAASKDNLTAGAALIGQSTGNGESPPQWNIQTFSPGVFFFIGLRDSNLSIGFSNYEAQDSEAVALETSDNIPSQTWFFETFKLLAPATFHGKRVLDAGNYTIELCHNNYYLYVLTSEDLSSTSGRAQGTKFTVTYADDTTPNFTLSYVDSYGTSYLVATTDHLETTDAKKKATEWVILLLEHNDGGDAYHICDASSGDPRNAISSRQITNRSKSYFALDPLAEQEVMQMWRFHDA